jgi:hypothetical protein
LLDWLRVECGIEKPSNKPLATTELDSDAWVGEVKRIRDKKLPLTAAGVHALRDEYTRTLEPARALAAETLKLEGSRLSAGKGISGAVPAIGNEPGRGTLPVASAILARAQDIALFLAFLA